jgi:2,3-bisphosphoglycerate-dependent phosphoglycerate mutase
MRLLYLIRHAQTLPTEGMPATDWPLTAEGHLQAQALAQALAQTLSQPLAAQFGELRVSRVITSTEPKAHQTGRAIAEHLGLPLLQRAGLQEHGRGSVTKVDAEVHLANMALLFARPSEHVYGDESADVARLRFAHTLERIMAGSEHDELVVSHGTVISLLIAKANDLDAQLFWDRVSLPDSFVLEWPSLRLLQHGFE